MLRKNRRNCKTKLLDCLPDAFLGLSIFNTKSSAEEYALYLVACTREGAEILHMSNPGDYDYDEDTFEEPEYEIIEIN